ncbi:cytochrome B [Corynebacterium yudongzhengii]|uniref:Heme A synthase n=2 Tax=Corynebacterium yudongzhengii TaxID=2080740 RepID=A0A2U1T8Z4_9CORY|nr:cytochrome B [Corynebacterium yudongzhengii]PWC02358.1 heme A synthase [Corynebacterium yudongzhengii]
MLLLIAQGGITVTGATVRVTGSGLGCNTWPLCHEGSLVPVAGAEPLVHQLIEFGNRMLTFVVAAAAVAVVVSMHRARRRRELKTYAWISLAGVGVQAVIGGVSVLVNLHWWAVAVHFLPSMFLVWVAALLYTRIAEPDDVNPSTIFPDRIRIMIALAAAALAIVLVTGTMVTGSGPHSGDDGVGMEGRLEMDTWTLALVHAGSMYVYLGFTVIAAIMLFRSRAPRTARTTVIVLLVMIAVQWAIGVTQLYLGVPRWTVPVHIAMSSIVVAFSSFLWANGRRRHGETRAPLTGSPAGDRRKTAAVN